ncbi:NepR family anti-sigma factor [Puniceibacterium confluentis]|uniref:NepR family anti-sigma factor n=1 Tax=Puniceibacterium confluentis TaxID=1958944 RepID=UPI00164526DE|nr:NepR family anti-sigma factor [Puniceibacterium confluentis]
MAQDRNKARQSQVIDDNLKRVYQDMLEEKVPDRFLDLLSQLKGQQDKETHGDAK